MLGDMRIYLSCPCVKFEQIVHREQIPQRWAAGNTQKHSHAYIYTHRCTHSELLLILTLFSEPVPKLQQCNQVLITRLWCLQAVSKRFIYLCVCKVRVCVWIFSMWCLLYSSPELLGLCGATNNVDCQLLHTHTHTHTRCSYGVFVMQLMVAA